MSKCLLSFIHRSSSACPSIRFTVEVEKGGTLPFLDTLLRRKHDGTLDVTVYRKPTHTDRYLDFRSHHPPHVKRGLVRCLFDRARSVTSTQDNLQKEECHLAKVLKQNGYPGAFIRSSRHPPRQEGPQESPSKKGTGHPWRFYLTLRGSARTSGRYARSLA